MKYLLDTNVVSEARKQHCNQSVFSFLKKLPLTNLYLSVATIGELCYGIEKLPASTKKHELSIWLYALLPEQYRNRIVDIDNKIMLEWGRIRAKIGRTLPRLDSLIAATAITHNMILVTRNVKDYEDIPGINLLNPWEFNVSKN